MISKSRPHTVHDVTLTVIRTLRVLFRPVSYVVAMVRCLSVRAVICLCCIVKAGTHYPCSPAVFTGREP